MALDPATISALAEHLDAAEREAREVVKITEANPELDWEDAYAIQDALRLRKAGRGVAVAGLKMGLTSCAKMEQMGVSEPIYGFLPADGAVTDGGEIDCAALIHPKIEAEIAFRLKSSLRGPGCDVEAVLAATDTIAPALEIIDSRYLNFQFDLKSVVADNTSAARFVVGRATPLGGQDLATLGVSLMRNGAVAAQATGAEVLGDPARAVAMLADMLARRGRELPAGTLVLSGAATIAVEARPGDHFEARWEGLGSASVCFA